jgi:Ca-activated chloride channel homolog
MGSLSFDCKPLFTNLNYQQDHNLDAILQIKAPTTEQTVRTPLDLIACVDTSGSMDWDGKIEMVRKSLSKLIEHLTEDDRLAVVTFSSHVKVYCKPLLMNTENKAKLQQMVSQLSAGGGTNLSDGLVKSLRLLNDEMRDINCIRRVIMFTDGDPTVGVINDGQILKLGKKFQGIGSVTTFGYGQDHKPELLKAMARQGKGNFYYAENPDKILSGFASELGGLISSAVQQMQIWLSPSNGVKLQEIYNDLTVETEEDGRVRIDLGDVLAGTEMFIAAGLTVDSRSKAFPRMTTILKGEIEYLDLATSSIVKDKLNLKIKFVKPDQADTEPDELVQQHVMLQKSVQVELEAQQLAEAGHFTRAAMVMNNFAADVGELGLMDLQADMAGTAGVYGSSVSYTAGGAQLAASRTVSKSSYRGTGAEVNINFLNVSNSVQDDMVSDWTSDSSDSVVVESDKVISTDKQRKGW